MAKVNNFQIQNTFFEKQNIFFFNLVIAFKDYTHWSCFGFKFPTYMTVSLFSGHTQVLINFLTQLTLSPPLSLPSFSSSLVPLSLSFSHTYSQFIHSWKRIESQGETYSRTRTFKTAQHQRCLQENYRDFFHNNISKRPKINDLDVNTYVVLNN